MDANRGFIREKLDIKILLLFILDKLPRPVKAVTLSELALFDGGFGWFEYTDCLDELVRSGHVQECEGAFAITDQGRSSVSVVGSSLPYSVRARAERLTAPVAAAMLRSSMIETAVDTAAAGMPAVSLRLSDTTGELMALRLSVPDEAMGQEICRRFSADAETLTARIIALLTEK